MPLIIPNTNPSSIAAVADSSTVSEDSLRQLDVGTIAKEIDRFKNSISHLERSNQELNQFANSSDPDDGLEESDRLELKNSVQENQGVISRQTNLISRLETILLEKTGVASNNPHYAIHSNPISMNSSNTNAQNDLNDRARQVLSSGSSNQQAQNGVSDQTQTQESRNEQEGEEEGMHL